MDESHKINIKRHSPENKIIIIVYKDVYYDSQEKYNKKCIDIIT